MFYLTIATSESHPDQTIGNTNFAGVTNQEFEGDVVRVPKKSRC